ncbi:hypothetical protein A4M37_19375 [Salmonella enterica subsp. enterica serovar Typhimurium]|nr:hypothetical protein [Salmonella enterica subsp. enterica serovar Typhimurium]
MKNTKRITFNLFEKSNGKINVTVMEGKASKGDKSFEIATGKTLTEMRKNAGIKDGAEWQITSRFDKRHVKPTLTEGEAVHCFARAVKGDEVYYLAVIKSVAGFRAVMHHKSKRNEYGVAIEEVAKRFRTTETECDVKNVACTVNTTKGGSFYSTDLQITSSFFCKKEAKKEVAPVIVEEVAVVESNEVETLKAEMAALKAENEALKAELAEIKSASVKEEVKEEAPVEVEESASMSIDEELEELLNYRWGQPKEEVTVEVKEIEEEKVEEEYRPAANIEELKAAFLKKNPVSWDDVQEEESVEFEIDENEMRMASDELHDAMYGTSYSVFAYAA